MTLVEFALIAPVLILLLMGIAVVSLVGANQVQLTNAVRDGARAAAVCGGMARTNLLIQPTFPDGSACGGPSGSSVGLVDLTNYIQSRLNDVPGGVSLNVCVTQTGSGGGALCSSGSSGDPQVIDHCQYHYTISVEATYDQPLYVPIVGQFLANDASGQGRLLDARAEAACER